MTLSRTLQLSRQKFDNLTSTYGQILSYTRQGPGIKKIFYYFLCVIINYGHFKPIPDKYISKIKFLGHF
jgi:hypothetical protein